MAKILIMDDEAGMRNVISSALKPTEHELYIAEDGQQALEISNRKKPDIAILDIRVPGLDGLEVLSELKKIDPTIQCIIVSGFLDTCKKNDIFYLPKPFRIEELISAINKALEAKNAHTRDNSPSQNNVK